MAYEDVPQRLADGDAVPASEIVGYYGPDASNVQVRYGCDVLVAATLMEKIYEDETLKYRLTSLGLSVRSSLITRLEGDCPECPDCP